MQDLSHYDVTYYERDQTFARYRILRPDQLAALCYALNWPYWGVVAGNERDPGLILSIGAGRGELERQLEELGHTVIGIDPSAGAGVMYQGKTLLAEWTPALVQTARTVIFCESIEHIPLNQTLELLNHVSSGALVIIVNFIDFYPIIPSVADGWDHITQVDDALYDQLSVNRRVLLRRKSHLVLEVP